MVVARFRRTKRGGRVGQEQLMMANVGFNATHQKIVFQVTEESSARDQAPTRKMENILAHAQEIFALAKSLVNDDEKNESPEKQSQTRALLLSEIAAEVQGLN
jgi:hypothetical protein